MQLVFPIVGTITLHRLLSREFDIVALSLPAYIRNYTSLQRERGRKPSLFIIPNLTQFPTLCGKRLIFFWPRREKSTDSPKSRVIR